MEWLRTMYRLVVMLAAGVIVVKGWQLYGPSSQQTKSFAIGILAKAQHHLGGREEPATADDPRLSPPPLVAATPSEPVEAAPLDAGAALSAPVDSEQNAVTLAPAEPNGVPASPPTAEDELAPLLSRLEQIGGEQPQLTAWGSSGGLYRFCCRAKPDESALIAQHFEAVAAEPSAAVGAVLAKVEEWRLLREQAGSTGIAP